MILTKVSAVCRVRDGYTGKTVSPGGMVCRLDGQRVRPVIKPEGYLIFTNLSPGAHSLSVQAAGYCEEPAELEIGDAPTELELVLKPGAGYPLQPGAAQLQLMLTKNGKPAASETLWLATPATAELKLSQTKAEAGETSFRLYCKGAMQLLPIPGTYLLADGKNSETVRLQSLTAEQGTLSAPLQKAHTRGCPLLPAQHYRADENGCVQAVFRSACKAEVWRPERKVLEHIELAAGENRIKL